MNALVRAVLRKEVVDGVRDRRSLASALIFPVMSPLLMLMVLSIVASTVNDNGGLGGDDEKKRRFAVVGEEHAPRLMEFLGSQGVEMADASDDPEALVRTGKLHAVLFIPEGFGEDFREGKPARIELMLDNSSTSGSAIRRKVKRLLNAYSMQVAQLRLYARGVDPGLLQPLEIQEIDMATPETRAAQIMEMLPMLVILSAFLCCMYIAIDVTAGERERGSLEALLINPISHLDLVMGKWLAAVSFGLFGVILTLATSLIGLRLFSLEELGIRVTIGLPEMFAILVVVIPVTLFAAAVQLLVATYSRSFKEAQTYLSMLLFLPMMPGMILAVKPINPDPWMMAVPMLGQQLIMSEVMRGKTVSPVLYLIAGASMIAFAFICVVATARLFRSEKIVFGR